MKDVGLTMLTKRKERGDAIEVFKMLNGYNHVDKNQWFKIESEEQRPTRQNVVIRKGERQKKNALKVETARLKVRKNFFNIWAANVWNNIPNNV